MSSSSLSASQSSIKNKSHSSDLRPLKLCVKYKPPSLALYYTLESTPDKKYMHVVHASKFIAEEISAADLYQKLLEKEGAYLNPRVVSKHQVLKLLDQLIARTRVRNSNIASSSPSNMTRPAEDGLTRKSGDESAQGDRSTYSKQLSLDSAVCSNPVLATNVDDLNPESAAVSGANIVFNRKEEEEKGERKAETKPSQPEEVAPEAPEKKARDKVFLGEMEDDEPAEPKKPPPPPPRDEEEPDKEKAHVNPAGEEDEEAELAKLMEQKQDMQRVYEEMLVSIAFCFML